MLSTFRSHAKGWIAWAFVILISVPFALWGIGQYRSLVTTNYVAKVNGAKIMPQRLDQAYEQAFQQRQNQMNGNYDPSSKQQKQLKLHVLNQLIQQQLLLQQASKDRLVTSSGDVRAQIEQIPAFQANGKFDFQQYKQVLANNGLNVPQFENQVRSSLLMQQLQEGIERTGFSTSHEVLALAALLGQQRKAAWFVLPLKAFKPAKPPSEDAVAAYYKSHQQQFSTPETVTVSYLQLNLDTLEKRVKTTPDALHEYYRTHQSQYGTPPARKVAEILIKPKASGTKAQAAAKAKSERLLHQIRAAKNSQKAFAELARKDSDDPVSSRNGGSIGYVSRGQLPEVLDNAVFKLSAKGSTAGPIKTARGWVLVQLLDQRSGAVKPYTKVKDQVAQDYKAGKAKALYYKLDSKFANLTYEHAGSLEEAAKALDLKIQTISGVTRNAGKGIAENAAIRKAAFSDSVLKQRQNSNPIKLGNENAVVLRVSGVTPSKVKPLANVRDQIVSAIDGQNARKAASAAAAKALAALRSGQAISAVAKAHGVNLQGPRLLKRTEQKVPSALIQSLFTLSPAPASQARYASTALPDGSQAVYALLGVKPGETKNLSTQKRDAYLQELERIHSDAVSQAYTDWLHSKADIKVVKDNIQ